MFMNSSPKESGTEKGSRGSLFADPFSPCAGLQLPDEDERDDQRVDDEGLDQREADDHRDEDLVLGGRVARDPSSPAAMALPWPIAPPNAAIAMPNPAARAMTAFTLSRRPAAGARFPPP